MASLARACGLEGSNRILTFEPKTYRTRFFLNTGIVVIYRFFLALLVACVATGSSFETRARGQLVVAISADGGWVIAKDTRFFARSIPDELMDLLMDYSGRGRKIEAVAFTPDGGWTLVAGASHAARNVGGDYYTVLDAAIKSGRSIRSVAFNPIDWKRSRGFVIAHDRGFESRNIPDELRSKLRELYGTGKTIDLVTFTPDGGWTIVYDGGSFTRGVGSTGKPGHTSYFDRITALVRPGGSRGEAVAFNPVRYDQLKGYLIVTSTGFEAQDIPDELVDKLKSVFTLDGVNRKTRASNMRHPPASIFKNRPIVRPSVRPTEPAAPVSYQPITTTGAEIDLRTFEVQESFEGRGDEPYMVIYRFRGRLYDPTRVHFNGLRMFQGDTGDAVFTNIVGGKNWGKSGTRVDVFANAGRTTFEQLAPLEVYGIVVVVAESDGTKTDDLYTAYELLQKKLVARFDRAIPFNGPRTRYTDYSKSNVNQIVSQSLKGLQEQFSPGFEDEVASTIRNWVGSGKDRYVGAQAVFYINAPPDLDAQPELDATLSTAAIAPPGTIGIGLRERALSRLFRGEVVQLPTSGYRYAVRGLHRLY